MKLWRQKTVNNLMNHIHDLTQMLLTIEDTFLFDITTNTKEENIKTLRRIEGIIVKGWETCTILK